MEFEDKILVLAEAKMQADVAFVEAVRPARDAYVQRRDSSADIEAKWLADIGNDTLRDDAREAWQSMQAARKALVDAAQSAATTRTVALEAAWTDIKAR